MFRGHSVHVRHVRLRDSEASCHASPTAAARRTNEMHAIVRRQRGGTRAANAGFMTTQRTTQNDHDRSDAHFADGDDASLREGTKDEKTRAVALVREFSIALLTTFDPGPHGWAPKPHSRPMTMLRIDDDGTVYFVTARETVATHRTRSRRRALLTLQSNARFAAMEGRIDVRDDNNLLREIWTKGCDVFFDGPEDPRAVALVFRPETVELWDNSNVKGLRFLFEAAKALLTGDKGVEEHPDQHLVVNMAAK